MEVAVEEEEEEEDDDKVDDDNCDRSSSVFRLSYTASLSRLSGHTFVPSEVDSSPREN